MRVLVVEDDFLVAFEVDDALIEAGHQVEVAQSTTTALDIISRRGADLALIELQLIEGSAASIGLARVLLEQFGVHTVFVNGAIRRARRQPGNAGSETAAGIGDFEMPFATLDLKTAMGIVEKAA